MRWASAPQRRDQMVLFAQRLDEVLPSGHVVRLLDEILGSEYLDWRDWEARYVERLGQPAIHPRVLASVLLYGLLTRIRSSRALEEALEVRLDFRWLAEGRGIDHTTLSEFRRRHGELLQKLFVQVGQVARRLGLLTLQRLAFDGTRVRSSNRRRGSRTPAELREEQAELQAKVTQLLAQAEAADAVEAETFPAATRGVPEELADTRRRQRRIQQALEELERIDTEGETLPKRLPLTDPQSRVMPNKEGGFAPNYTPTALVDTGSGLIVEASVLGVHNEDQHLVPALQRVQADFGLETPPPEVLGDGLIGTGANLAALEELGVTLYSPCEIPDPATNPALREDPTRPVAEPDWERLPMKTSTVAGQRRAQLDKSAFLYDSERDCYWCPQGQPLTHVGTTSEKSGTGQRIRRRYRASASACGGCPLRDRCLQGKKVQSRQINREQYEAQREQHAARMSTPEAQEKYAQRCHVGERPFATIKQQFGLRQFLTRGLQRVQTEWRWAALAFNLHRLIALLRTRAGPDAPLLPPNVHPAPSLP